MEDHNTPIDSGTLYCSQCNALMEVQNVFCPECGFPENGTQEERSKFYAQKIMKKNEHMDADKKIKSARNVLFILSAIIFLFGIVTYLIDEDIATLLTSVILSIIYLGLGFWSSKKPLAAILLALLLYLTTIIISTILEPENFIRGIIFKVIIIVYLGKGVYSASAIKNR